MFGFLGPNGAGKTTTVRTLGTLIAPSSGEAEVAGIPLTEANAAAIRRSITIMPEAPGLYLRLTVFENLEFFAGLYGVRDAKRRITAALEAVNLQARSGDLAGTLSKGLRQRVALARSLLSEPRVMFLDEPTSGLDPVAAREVHELLDSLRRRGVTVFLTTHRLDEAERLCDRVAILNRKLLTIGSPDQLRRQLFSTVIDVRTALPLDSPQLLFPAIDGVLDWSCDGPGCYLLTVSDSATVTPRIARALVSVGADITRLAEREKTLEDVYLQLVDNDGEGAK